MTPQRIFVSHSHQDNMWCESFVTALRQKGVDPWFDQHGLYVGTQWIKTLQQEIQGRDIFLIILTPDAWNSQWVQEELYLALGQRKAIIGVIHKPTKLDGFITSRQLLDVVGQDSSDAANTVYSALERLSSREISMNTSPSPDENILDGATVASPASQVPAQRSLPKYHQLGQLLKEHRRAKRIDQAKLARVLGVSLPVIAQIELGTLLPSPSTIRYLGETMQLSDEEIEQLIQLSEQLQSS